MTQTIDLDTIGPFPGDAYRFVIAALEGAVSALPERAHVSASAVLKSARARAIEYWGVMALPVLESWGIRSTEDIGRAVWALTDAGVLSRRPEDRLEDFAGGFDFDTAFRAEYPWVVAL
jgi:uncharacterized repeat protein (TIGR04138 family)